MKIKLKHIFIVFTGISVLNGCQTGPRIDNSQSLSNKAAQLAFKQHPYEPSSRSACMEALEQLGSRAFSDAQNPCEDKLDDLRSKRNMQDLNNLHHQQQDQQQQAQNTFNQRIAAIRAGSAKVQTAQEAAVIYDAADGTSVIKKPLLHPDGRYYVIHGVVDPLGGVQTHNFVIRYTPKIDSVDSAALAALQQGFVDKLNGEDSSPQYARITFTGKDAIPENARIGSEVEIVGTYTGNRAYVTVAGAKRIMPEFTGRFVQVLR